MDDDAYISCSYFKVIKELLRKPINRVWEVFPEGL